MSHFSHSNSFLMFYKTLKLNAFTTTFSLYVISQSFIVNVSIYHLIPYEFIN